MPESTTRIPAAPLSSARRISVQSLNQRVICGAFLALGMILLSTPHAAGQQPGTAQKPAAPEAPAAPQAAQESPEAKLPEPGSMSGTVLDESGTPVEQAAVQAYDGFGMPIRLRTVHTDHSGHFVMYSVHPGDWALFVSKVEDGYADQLFGFGVSRRFRPAHVIVKSGVETSGVVIHLPAKAATVRIEVSDASTNKPLRSMVVDVQQVEPGRPQPMDNNGWMHARRPSPADLLIAPGMVRLTVTSAGYETWTAVENDRHFLTLRPGDHRVLQVKLHVGTRPTGPPRTSRPTVTISPLPSPIVPPARGTPAMPPQANTPKP